MISRLLSTKRHFGRSVKRVIDTSNSYFYLEACSSPAIPNGRIAGDEKEIYRSGDRIAINCDARYLPPDFTTTCQRTRAWSPNPECFRFCNDTSDVEHEFIDEFPPLANGEYGIVSYNTELFYLKAGSVEVKCLNSRKLSWSQVPELGKTIRAHIFITT